MKVAVYCGSRSGNDPLYAEKARELGDYFGRNGIELVFGGGHVGLMGVVADAVLAAGGRVHGVIPEHLRDRELAHSGLTELHVVKNMHERKALMADLADGFVALPGGIGTLEELFEAMTWAQLGFHEKPVGLLNVNGFYDRLTAFLSQLETEGFLRAEHKSLLIDEHDPGALLERLRSFSMPPGVSWLSRQAARTLGP